MSIVSKCTWFLSCVLIAAIAGPVAMAGELPPAPGLASQASSNRYIEDRKRDARISTPDTSSQRAGDTWANRLDSTTPAQRGNRLLGYGRQAMRDGDSDAACSYFSQARQAFSEGNLGRGVSRSEDLMTQTCRI